MRQLRLNLSPQTNTYEHERVSEQMPPRQNPRPGLFQLARAGRQWEEEKISDLAATFGETFLVGSHNLEPTGRIRYTPCNLLNSLQGVVPNRFLIEAEFEICNTFERFLGIEAYRTHYNLNYSKLRPDIIEVLPPNTFNKKITPDGHLD